MILVTGATGTIGSEVVKGLLARDETAHDETARDETAHGNTTHGGTGHSGTGNSGTRHSETIRVMTRNPTAGTVPVAVEVVFGDFDQPGSLLAAAEGVRALFLLSAPGPTLPAHDLAMIEAARKAGVERVVKLSAIGTGDLARVSDWHEPGEEAVRQSGLSWTILRPTTFASNTLAWVDAIRSGRPVQNMFGTGKQGVVDPADVAAVAVEALAGPGGADPNKAKTVGRTEPNTANPGSTGQSTAGQGTADHNTADHNTADPDTAAAPANHPIYTLTGPELISVPEHAAQLSDILGRPIDTADITPQQARDQMKGLSAEFVEVAIRGAAYVRDGHNAVVTDDVARILGRPPRTFREWAERHRGQFS